MSEGSKLDELYRIIFIGDGDKDPISVRMAVVENEMANVEEKVNKMAAGQAKLFWLLLATLLGVVVNLALAGHKF